MTNRPRRGREHKIIHAVACPACGVAVHQGCRLTTPAERATARGRLLVHGQRRQAWQTWRRSHAPDVYVQSIAQGRIRLRPQNDAIREYLRHHASDLYDVEADEIRTDRREIIDVLAEDGWHVE